MIDFLLNVVRKFVATWVSLLLGLIIFACEYLVEPHTFPERLLEHFSISFFITGIVLFLYEYGAKEKKVHESLVTLNQLITKAAGLELDRLLEIRFRDETGNCPSHLDKSRDQIETLINKVLELQGKKIRVDGKWIDLWAKDKYIDFINHLLTDVVVRNANNLVDIGNIGDKTFHVASPENIADKILAAQMSAMEKSNHYDVISDLTSWQNGQLSEFRTITKERVGKGVTVRRIFNIIHLERTLDRMVTHRDDNARLTDLRNILRQHLDDSQDWGTKDEGKSKYEIRIVGHAELESSAKKNYLEDNGIHDAHFGLFDHGEGVVRFTVTKPNLSDMGLSTDLDRIEANRSVFNTVWDLASNELTEEQFTRIIGELERIVEVRRTR